MMSNPFSSILPYNLIFIHTGEECDTRLFQMDLSGGINEAYGEDFSFEPLCLPVHSAGCVHLNDSDPGSALNHHLSTVPKTTKTLIVEKKPL